MKGDAQAMKGFMSVFYTWGLWLSKMMLIHFIWLLLTLLGFGVFGVFPATFAAAKAIYQIIKQEDDQNLYKGIWRDYRTHFIKANSSGFIWLFISVFLYFDFRVSEIFIQSTVIHFFLVMVGFVAVSSFLMFITIFVRYELTVFQYFKQALFIAIAQPLEAIALVISSILLIYLFLYLPALSAMMGISVILYPIIWFGHRACVSVEEKNLAAN